VVPIGQLKIRSAKLVDVQQQVVVESGRHAKSIVIGGRWAAMAWLCVAKMRTSVRVGS